MKEQLHCELPLAFREDHSAFSHTGESSHNPQLHPTSTPAHTHAHDVHHDPPPTTHDISMHIKRGHFIRDKTPSVGFILLRFTAVYL